MCGIVSYIGNKEAKKILIEGLKSIEYRGYDSSGISVANGTGIDTIKNAGKIAELEKLLNNNPAESFTKSTCGIGHTRWATHGEPNNTNAHPHQVPGVAIVHNGIIKNYLELKNQLTAEGAEFQTETDTEVIVKLFAKYQKKLGKGNELEALRQTIKDLDGTYALSLLCYDENGRKILVARNESPLVIGVGEKENFVASDSATVLQFTDKVLRLNDFELGEITENSITIEDIEGKSVKPRIQQLERTTSLLEKGAYKHFLLKEIHEQASVIRNILANFDKPPEAKLENAKFNFNDTNIDIANIDRIVIVACGTAFHSGLVGKYLIELWAKIPVEVVVASEYINSPTILNPKTLVIGISQSGETADTLGAIKNAVSHNAQAMAITNRADSAIADLCSPNVFFTNAGVEVSVAATKTFTAQVTAMYLLALELAKGKENLSSDDINKIKDELHLLPQLIEQCIEKSEKYYDEFIKFSNYRDFIFLSRGINYPIALEGALKLKELSYIHATGYASGEMKHGPIAILDHTVPVLSIAIKGESELEKEIYEKSLHNAEEARARKSPSLLITCEDNHDLDEVFDTVIRIPKVSQIFSPIIATIPLQFLAYYIAEDLGKDVDQPRNLAKSVTVE